MKMIIVIIQPSALDTVRESLLAHKIERITVSKVAGHGRQVEESIYRGQVVIPSLTAKVRLEIAVNDEFVEPAIAAILKSAKHSKGQLGDGKIFVLPLEQCIRIRTKERGKKAI